MPIRCASCFMAVSLLVGSALCMPGSVQASDLGQQIALLNKSQVNSRHPDLFYRDAAISSYQAGSKERAMSLFLKAARFADKPSQAIIATMYWNGDGVPQDRALAYAWIDLAADRGYADLLAQRERYWAQLSPDERQRATEQGRQVYAEYGDAQGLKRLDNALRRELARATGSRTGFGGNNVTVLLRGEAGSLLQHDDGAPVVLGGTPVRGTDYYAPALWSAAPYARLKDQVWRLSAAEMGTVDVGPLQSLPASAGSDSK